MTKWVQGDEIRVLTFVLIAAIVMSILIRAITCRLVGITHKDSVLRMGFHMLFQILGPLERLSTEFTSMGLQRHMNTNV